MPEWFEIDRRGLGQVLARRGKAFAVFELMSNAWDEPGVSSVEVTLDPIPGRAAARLRVLDDAPEGFARLDFAWTLFAPSPKKDQAAVRGRFNLGEKLVLALCAWAEIVTTTGGVRFDDEGRHRLRRKRQAGSLFEAELRMTREEIEECAAAIRQLIPPAGVVTTFNGRKLAHRPTVVEFEAVLPTVLADAEGFLRPTKRTCRVVVYDAAAGETPSLYELGIPVVETGDRWNADVQQKVPLNLERDNVPPSYLRLLRTLVANHTAQLLTQEDAGSTWVQEALGDDRVEPEVVERALTKLYGRKRVAYDPSDPEANKIATSRGYAVVHGGAFNRRQWRQIRRAKALPPAGQVTPSPKVLLGPDAKPPIPPDQWTPGMQRLASYTRALGLELLGFEPTVEFQDQANEHQAWWGDRTITFNLRRLGRDWPDLATQAAVDALLLHEFAHDRVGDHLDRAALDEVARLGARLRWSALTLRNEPLAARQATPTQEVG
jgi:hypothetical protein